MKSIMVSVRKLWTDKHHLQISICFKFSFCRQTELRVSHLMMIMARCPVSCLNNNKLSYSWSIKIKNTYFYLFLKNIYAQKIFDLYFYSFISAVCNTCLFVLICGDSKSQQPQTEYQHQQQHILLLQQMKIILKLEQLNTHTHIIPFHYY